MIRFKDFQTTVVIVSCLTADNSFAREKAPTGPEAVCHRIYEIHLPLPEPRDDKLRVATPRVDGQSTQSIATRMWHILTPRKVEVSHVAPEPLPLPPSAPTPVYPPMLPQQVEHVVMPKNVPETYRPVETNVASATQTPSARPAEAFTAQKKERIRLDIHVTSEVRHTFEARPPKPKTALAEKHIASEGFVCGDGTSSTAAHRRGACSHHGGIRD